MCAKRDIEQTNIHDLLDILCSIEVEKLVGPNTSAETVAELALALNAAKAALYRSQTENTISPQK